MKTLEEIKAALKAAKIATKGLDEAALRAAYARMIEDQENDDDDDDEEEDVVNTSGRGFEDFMAARYTAGQGGKIFNRPGKGGKNPFLNVEQEVLGDVLSVEEYNGPKGLTNKIRVAVKGASVTICYSTKPFKVDDLVIVKCRILEPGVYMDADANKAQRELVVEKGRKAAYQISDIKMASVVRVQVAIALKQSATPE